MIDPAAPLAAGFTDLARAVAAARARRRPAAVTEPRAMILLVILVVLALVGMAAVPFLIPMGTP